LQETEMRSRPGFEPKRFLTGAGGFLRLPGPWNRESQSRMFPFQRLKTHL